MYENCYYVTERKPDDYHMRTATNKARADVEATLRELGMTEVPICVPFRGENASLKASLQEHGDNYDVWKQALAFLGNEDTLVIQFPSISHCIFLGLLIRQLRRKGVRVILLIHDLEKLRFIQAKQPVKTRVRQMLDESRTLKAADLIIVHNGRMAEYLKDEGIPAEKLVELEIFDYRMPADFVPVSPEHPGDKVIIAGNLDSDKVGYLKQLGRVPDVMFQLYGVGYKDEAMNATYHGSFLPDELPEQLHGNYGLVWDGDSVGTCTGNYGNYLKYNDPHKTSLYLVSGLPVIVWDRSAIAEFVLAHGAGIAVPSLLMAGEDIAALSEDEYASLCANAAALSADLRDGHYLKQAVAECMERLG